MGQPMRERSSQVVFADMFAVGCCGETTVSGECRDEADELLRVGLYSRLPHRAVTPK